MMQINCSLHCWLPLILKEINEAMEILICAFAVNPCTEITMSKTFGYFWRQMLKKTFLLNEFGLFCNFLIAYTSSSWQLNHRAETVDSSLHSLIRCSTCDVIQGVCFWRLSLCFVCMYVCKYVCMYVCMYVRMYACKYVCM